LSRELPALSRCPMRRRVLMCDLPGVQAGVCCPSLTLLVLMRREQTSLKVGVTLIGRTLKKTESAGDVKLLKMIQNEGTGRSTLHS
jgi:hypothetical protein